MFIGVIKFLSLWEGGKKNTHLLLEKTLGPQTDYFVEWLIRSVCALQFVAGFFILTNNSKIGAQILGCTLLVFLLTSYNPFFNGFDYESLTLFVNEASLYGICIILYAYENSQVSDEVLVEETDSQTKSNEQGQSIPEAKDSNTKVPKNQHSKNKKGKKSTKQKTD